MEAIKELISRYGLEEDHEHIIIPFRDRDGRKKRCFLLKRPFLRIVYPDGHFTDFPIEEVIEAIMTMEPRFRAIIRRAHSRLKANVPKRCV